MIYTNCLNLVKTIDYNIQIIPIRVRIRKLELSECSRVRRRNMARPHQTPCLMGSASKHMFCARYLTLKMTSDQKTFTMKIVRIIQTVKFSFGRISIRGCLPPQKKLQGAANLKRTTLESSNKTNLNLTRVLDVNPSLFLAREVQPPLI